MNKKIIFLARSLDSSRVMADRLLCEGLIDSVIFETGKLAKKKKLVRLFKQKPFWKVLTLPLDLAFLIYLNAKGNQLFYQKYPRIPQVPIDLWVDDANEEKCIEYLKQQKPDILLIYGTAVLKKSVLSIPKTGCLNIHGGIVPKYRNVHGEFWAVAHRRFHELGTSLLMVDEGVDTGDVVSQRSFGISQPLSVSEAKQIVFDETLKETLKVLKDVRMGVLPRAKQESMDLKPFQTPKFMDWIRYRVRI